MDFCLWGLKMRRNVILHRTWSTVTHYRWLFGIVCGLCLLLIVPIQFLVGQERVLRREVRPGPDVERLQRGMRDLDRLSDHDLDEVAKRFRGELAHPGAESAEQRLRQKLKEAYAFESKFPEHRPPLSLQPPNGLRPSYVRWVQESLNRVLGSDLRVDGLLTEQTTAAIRQFQGQNGLVPDGIVGPKTEGKLAEVTNTYPPVLWLHSPSLRDRAATDWLKYFDDSPSFDSLLERIKVAKAQSQAFEPPRKLLFLEVKKRWTGISVVARASPDFWFLQAGFPEFSHATPSRVSSAEELDRLIGDATTVIHQGDELPREWQDHLQTNREYLRSSSRSPKQSISEFTEAVQLLDHRAESGKTRILSALPQARNRDDLLRELASMDLQASEVERWQQLQGELERLQAQSNFRIEAATKEAFLQELTEGQSDYVVLIAHFADGKLHFPGGETMTTEELGALQRSDAPPRALIFVSCNAGTVNAPLASAGEIALGGRMAQGVVAHPDPVSALQVPDLLREFLIDAKKIRDVFMRRGYRFITEDLWRNRTREKNGQESRECAMKCVSPFYAPNV